jgi:hypothetical protein
VIAITNNPITWNLEENLVIPPGKFLYLYNTLAAAVAVPPITIEVQGDLVVGYRGTLSAGADHQVKVSGEGSIKVQDTGVLATDVPASVNDGAATVLGTPQVLIDGYGKDYADNPTNPVGKSFIGATLRYTNSVLSTQWALVETAFDSYITQGILELSSAFFKPSDLVKLVTERPASVGKKAFKAKALENETETALTIPVNAYILTDSDGFTGVTSLTVSGHLDTNILTPVFGGLTSLTIAGGGILDTDATFGSVDVADFALGGSLINTNATFASLDSLTVNGRMELYTASFTALTSLNITAGSSLEAPLATFANLQSLTIGDGATFEADVGTFDDLDGTLTVNGTFTAPQGTFDTLNELVVNGTLEVGGVSAFPRVTILTVTGKGKLDLQNASDHLAELKTLTVENGANIISLGSSVLQEVTELTVRGSLAVPTATWRDLLTLTVTETGEFTAIAGGANFNAVTSLTLNGTFTATSGIFDGIANVEGAGTLIARGAVGLADAIVLYNSSLTSVSLGNTVPFDITADEVIIVPSGKTRIFTAVGGNIPKQIVVESGATLELAADGAAPTAIVGGGPTRLIEVSGTLKFTGATAAPDAPITVKEGGALIFDGINATTGTDRDITVNSGATLAFNKSGAAPKGNITVNGTLVVGNGGILTIFSAKTLNVTGALDAGDLTAKGFAFTPAAGGAFVITGNYYSGSTIAARIATGVQTLEFVFQPNGYIRDVAGKSPWSIEGGETVTNGNFGNLTLTGTAATTQITLGQGKIVTNADVGLSLGSNVGVVTLNNGAYLVAKPYSGPAQIIGLTLEDIIIDLTDAGKIVVEPGSKLNLVKPSNNNGIPQSGSITTKRDETTANTGLIGSNAKPGDLSTGIGSSLNTVADGVINGGAAGKTIDRLDTFGGSATNITVTRN